MAASLGLPSFLSNLSRLFNLNRAQEELLLEIPDPNREIPQEEVLAQLEEYLQDLEELSNQLQPNGHFNNHLQQLVAEDENPREENPQDEPVVFEQPTLLDAEG